MRVLVTGANGLLGHHVVKELVSRGHTVSIIVRQTDNIFFPLTELAVFKADFTCIQALREAAKGCDAIIHMASVTSTHLLHYTDYKTVNVDGTATIIQLANELNINRLVYVSTANTVGFGNREELANECSEMTLPFTQTFYAQSKYQAEKLVLTFSQLPNKHVVIINPTFIIGAYDTKPSSGKLLLMGYKRLCCFVPKGGKNFVPAKDVSTCVCNALTQGVNGERYLVSGLNLSFRDFYNIQKRLFGYKQCIIPLPNVMLSLVGKVGDVIRACGIESDICSMNIQQLLIQEYYTNQKAMNDLHLQPSDLECAIFESLDWLIKRQQISN